MCVTCCFKKYFLYYLVEKWRYHIEEILYTSYVGKTKIVFSNKKKKKSVAFICFSFSFFFFIQKNIILKKIKNHTDKSKINKIKFISRFCYVMRNSLYKIVIQKLPSHFAVYAYRFLIFCFFFFLLLFEFWSLRL